MGYTTDFTGSFSLNKPLSAEHNDYLTLFSQTRRMKRNQSQASKLPDLVRNAAKLPIGNEGAYFVGGGGDYGQAADGSVLDFNSPPLGQPSLWNHWVPSEDGNSIVWDGGEKFYEYKRWINYITEHFLKPWGYVLNGDVEWIGEDPDDRGMLSIKDNVLKIKRATIVWQEVE